MEYTSTVKITIDGNKLDAPTRSSYVEKLKKTYYEEMGIHLEESEIGNIIVLQTGGEMAM